MVLEKSKSVSVLAFLRSLQAARACIGALVDDLKAHGMTEHPEAVSLQVSMTLDQQVDELFTPYLSGSSYIDCETRSLEELYSSLLFKYTIFHVCHACSHPRSQTCIANLEPPSHAGRRIHPRSWPRWPSLEVSFSRRHVMPTSIVSGRQT